jgi:hypothetical protein
MKIGVLDATASMMARAPLDWGGRDDEYGGRAFRWLKGPYLVVESETARSDVETNLAVAEGYSLQSPSYDSEGIEVRR